VNRQTESVCDAVDLIRAERERQIASEGWTPEHDDDHDEGEMALAAASYAIAPEYRDRTIWVPNTPGTQLTRSTVAKQTWPKSWGATWFKPVPDDRIRELVKAGALIVAEIERLQRV
jgi:hypothetical protein